MPDPPKFTHNARREREAQPIKGKGKSAGLGSGGSVPEKTISGYDAVIRLQVDPPNLAVDVAQQIAGYDGVQRAGVVRRTMNVKSDHVDYVTNDCHVIAAVVADTVAQLEERLMHIAEYKYVVDYPANTINRAWGRNGFP